MKKPMKFKRYEGGGEISGEVDPKEAAAKEAGLKASKGDDVGFFQRLRMGNIDDPSSEAYKRFGAGRGRLERNPVNESVSVSGSEPVVRPSMRPNPIFEEGRKQGMRQPSGDASVAEDYANRPRNPEAIMEADNPRKTAPRPNAPKPDASKPSKATTSRTRLNTEAEQEADNPIGSRSMVGVPGTLDKRGVTDEKRTPRFTPNEPPVATHKGKRDEENQSKAPVDMTKLSLAERQKLKNERLKSTDVTKLSLSERSKLGMKSGGSVSSASRRADGIATKGKTRGKIC
jgi:hypothetical protein